MTLVEQAGSDGTMEKVLAGESSNVVRLDGAERSVRFAFLGWQCRIRQMAVRANGGRPTSGMRPTLEVGVERVGPITVLLNKLDEQSTATQFHFMVKKTKDPADRHDAALHHLAATYYQRPDTFSDRLTALFAPEATLPRQVSGRTDCGLSFDQFNQRWRLICKADLLDPDAALYQATYWHNALFNPRLPGGAQILAFTPDWSRAEAEPLPT